MTGWANGGTQPVSVEPDHIIAILFEDIPVACFRPRGLGEPPHILDGIPDPYPADCNPLCRHRHFGRVIPETLLGKMKSDLLHESDEEFEMINGACGDAFIVTSADVEYKATIVGEHTVDFTAEREKPINVFPLRGVAVLLLEM